MWAIGLLIQPDLIQMLVQIVARSNLPTLYVRAMGVNFPPPQGRNNVGFFAIYPHFELPHEPALLSRVAGAEHGLMPFFHFFVGILSIVVGSTAQIL